MHDVERVANLLGAAGVGVADLVREETAGLVELSPSAAAALVVLSGDDGLSGTELGRRIGISQSAAARMVDSLEVDQLVERGPGAGREVAVRLTDAGRETAQMMLAERRKTLRELLSDLTDGERATLDRLLTKVLGKVAEYADNGDRVCRLCDRAACTKNAVCPVGHAERSPA